MRDLDRRGVEFSIGVKQSKTIRALIAQIPEADWVTIADYPDTGQAQIAETRLGTFRLIVRRTRLVGAQAELWPDWRHHCFATNRTVPAAHRRYRSPRPRHDRARDPRPQRPSAAPFPVRSDARQQRLDRDRRDRAQPRTLDHAQIGLPDRPVQTARARRRHLLQIPARLTRTSRPGLSACPPAGPGRPTSPPSWTRSARSPPAPDPRSITTSTSQPSPPPRRAHPCPKTPAKALP